MMLCFKQPRRLRLTVQEPVPDLQSQTKTRKWCYDQNKCFFFCFLSICIVYFKANIGLKKLQIISKSIICKTFFCFLVPCGFPQFCQPLVGQETEVGLIWKARSCEFTFRKWCWMQRLIGTPCTWPLSLYQTKNQNDQKLFQPSR